MIISMMAATTLGSSLAHFNVQASLMNSNTMRSNNNHLSFKQSTRNLFLRVCDSYRRKNNVGSVKASSPVMEWQDGSSSIEVNVPCSVAYECYSDRESIPKWMTFISSVKILEDKPDLSRWSMKYHAFGHALEFSWLSRNMQPIPNQKIHWRSIEGFANSGAVQFFPKGQSSCRIEITTSYEVPPILLPLTAAFKPLFEYSISCGLERFAKYAEDHFRKAPWL